MILVEDKKYVISGFQFFPVFKFFLAFSHPSRGGGARQSIICSICNLVVRSFSSVEVVGAIKSLECEAGLLSVNLKPEKHWSLSREGEEIVGAGGSHEARVFGLVPPNGIPQQELMQLLGKENWGKVIFLCLFRFKLGSKKKYWNFFLINVVFKQTFYVVRGLRIYGCLFVFWYHLWLIIVRMKTSFIYHFWRFCEKK